MTSQILAIYFLNDLDHLIKEELKIKYYIRYQDDGCLYHKSKDYLNYCLKRIDHFLKDEKLFLNNKTRIYKNTNNFIFLGRNKYGKYSKYRVIKRRIKNKYIMYRNKKIKLNNLMSTINSYKFLLKGK